MVQPYRYQYFDEGQQALVGKLIKKAELNRSKLANAWVTFEIPSIKLSQALFLRRNNLYPKFVLNEAQAYTTDTMHRVFINEGVNHKAFVVSYYNSLSFAFAEILGRNFGGGVLVFEIEFVKKLFKDYKPVELEIWHTFTDTTMKELLER